MVVLGVLLSGGQRWSAAWTPAALRRPAAKTAPPTAAVWATSTVLDRDVNPGSRGAARPPWRRREQSGRWLIRSTGVLFRYADRVTTRIRRLAERAASSSVSRRSLARWPSPDGEGLARDRCRIAVFIVGRGAVPLVPDGDDHMRFGCAVWGIRSPWLSSGSAPSSEVARPV